MSWNTGSERLQQPGLGLNRQLESASEAVRALSQQVSEGRFTIYKVILCVTTIKDWSDILGPRIRDPGSPKMSRTVSSHRTSPYSFTTPRSSVH